MKTLNVIIGLFFGILVWVITLIKNDKNCRKSSDNRTGKR
jgi:hypothetical protein